MSTKVLHTFLIGQTVAPKVGQHCPSATQWYNTQPIILRTRGSHPTSDTGRESGETLEQLVFMELKIRI